MQVRSVQGKERRVRGRRPARLLLLLAILFVMTACRRAPDTPEPASPSATAATHSPPTAAAAPSPMPTASPAPTASLLPSATAPRAAPLDFEWTDREIYRPNLLPGEQLILQQLPTAPVYRLDLRISADLTTVMGTQQVHFTNGEAISLDELFFRLYPNILGGRLIIQELHVAHPEANEMLPVVGEYSAQNSVVRVPLPAPLAPGDATVVTFSFVVEVPTTAGSNYGILVYDQNILALAHFYPQLAVYDDEGWNLEVPPPFGDVVYAESTFYQVRVRAPEGLTVAATGALVQESTEAGTVTRTYVAGPVRDFYLAGSMSFVTQEVVVDGVRVIAYAPAPLAASNRRALDSSAASLEIFAALYGPYPYTELEVVTTPTSALGVEYPGVIAIAVRLYDEAGGRDPVRESTVAHEVAHQWFYGLVGNDQLDEPWLDESLTQYATLRYFEERYGAAGAVGFRESLTGRWNSVNSSAIPIGQPVEAYSGIEYGAIVYGRGPLFFVALREEIGDDAFEQFLDAYVSAHRYGVATTDSLRAAAEAACLCDLSALFATWVEP